MQGPMTRRSNRERSEETRERLIAAARRLFVEKSYAETGTPEIVQAAGVTRGALYHHFADKQALFRAVVEREAQAVAEEIERKAISPSPVSALLEGGSAFLQAMAVPGRTRLLLLDGPAVLGRAGMDEIEGRHGNRTLREGLAEAIRAGALPPLPLAALTALLAAAFDRAALAVAEGGDEKAYRKALAGLIEGLAASAAARRAGTPAQPELPF
jgi:AcrR family transcriptional regulator